MKDELISIIIPVYNIEDYVKKCVNSVLKQTYNNIEILLIDDGATDGSGKICDELAKKDSRIKVFHKKNGGLSDARNYGIEKCKGKYITTIDGDDFVGENYIYNLYFLLTDNDADISATNRSIFHEDMNNGIVEKVEFFNNYPNTKVFTSHEYVGELLGSKLPHEAWAKLYKKEIFEKEKYIKGLKVFEDFEFIVRILKNDKLRIVCNTSMCDYYYRLRNTSIMREKYNDYWDKELEFYANLLNDKEYKEYERGISYLLSIMTIRNFCKIIIEGEKYERTKNIQKSAKYIKLKYCKYNLDRIKIFLLKHFPRMLFVFWKTKWLNREEIKFKKSFNNYFKNCVKNNSLLYLIFNGPTTANLGDHAILFAEEEYLSKEKKKSFSISSKEMKYFFKNELYKKVRKDDYIYITGGGNTGSLWRQEQSRINQVLKIFKDNKIIIFPQTIYYSEGEFGQECFEKDLRIYKECSNITFQCREKQTYDFVINNLGIPAILTKDITLTLDYTNLGYKRSGILFCFRNDIEKKIDDIKKKKLIDTVTTKYKNEEIHYIDTVLKRKDEYSYNEAKKEFSKMITKFASSKLVVTDRLHGMIFAKITNTPCIAIDNLTGKVKGVYETIKDENCDIIFIKDDEIGDNLWKKLDVL